MADKIPATLDTPAAPPPRAPYTFRGEGTGLFQQLSWNAGRLFSRIVSVLFFRLHASGQESIPKTSPVLMVTNHQSFLDPWLIGIAPSRQIHYMARDTLFNKKGAVGGFLTWLMQLWNAFPVKRGSADLGAIRMSVERLDKGFVLNVFPEGTRSEDGTIGPIAPGVSLILNRCKKDVSIVPVIIDGAFEAWPRKAKFPRPRPVRICYGKPILPETWRPWSSEELAKQMRRALVALQGQMHSVHAENSAARVEREELQTDGGAKRVRDRSRDRKGATG